MNVLILGPQGAGKGTQAARIAATYGIPHIATGDMFRAAIASGSELGREVEPILAAGRLVPDELTISLIRERLGEDDAADGFVLDGFPRNLAQAEALDAMFAEHGIDLDVVVALQVPDEVAHARLIGRGRSDDTAEAIAQRLADYHQQTEPLIEYYRARDRLAPIDGAASEDDVFARIGSALETAAEHVR
jgi:adenylate kinase